MGKERLHHHFYHQYYFCYPNDGIIAYYDYGGHCRRSIPKGDLLLQLSERDLKEDLNNLLTPFGHSENKNNV